MIEPYLGNETLSNPPFYTWPAPPIPSNRKTPIFNYRFAEKDFILNNWKYPLNAPSWFRPNDTQCLIHRFTANCSTIGGFYFLPQSDLNLKCCFCCCKKVLYPKYKSSPISPSSCKGVFPNQLAHSLQLAFNSRFDSRKGLKSIIGITDTRILLLRMQSIARCLLSKILHWHITLENLMLICHLWPEFPIVIELGGGKLWAWMYL